MIKIDKLTKRFGGKTAVNGLSLQIREGEFFSFLGPNGAGKTTTIKIICGLMKPTSGTVTVGGHNVQSDFIKSKSIIGYIPDSPFLYDKLTAREFMQFVGGLYGMDEKAVENKTIELFEILGVSGYADELAEEYSHGMRQKVVMCATLLHSPKVIIIDEPMVGLDPKSTKLVKTLLKERVKAGSTVFMSTHTLPLAEELSGRVGIINNGKLAWLGEVLDLRQAFDKLASFEDIFLELTSGGNDG